jgi:hypothetical protein
VHVHHVAGFVVRERDALGIMLPSPSATSSSAAMTR